MRERDFMKRRGLYVQMPGLITAGFLDQIPGGPQRSHELPTKTIQINGTTLHYFEYGSGEPVVFVHGSIGDYRTWGYQLEEFSRHYHTVSYSRRYHYPNDWDGDGSDYSSLLHARDLAAFIDSLGLGPVHLVGQSYGAIVMLMMARERADCARTLTLCEPGYLPWLPLLPGGEKALNDFSNFAERAKAVLDVGNEEEAIEIFMDGVLPGWYHRVAPEARTVLLDNARELKAELAAPNWLTPLSFEDITNIKIPTLIVDGGDTIPLFRIINDKIKELLPSARRELCLGSPHGAHFATPDVFNRVVLAFLESNRQA